MKACYFIIALIFISLQFATRIYAQGGGPPMLTDDPGTAAYKHWEINTTVNSAWSAGAAFQVPLIDLNYGYNDHTQLKLEMPYQVYTGDNKNFPTLTQEPIPGIKYRFLNEDKDFISVSTYPQVAIGIYKHDSTQYLLPLELEKTIGRFVIGADIGAVLVKHYAAGSINGNLLGFKVSDKLEVMAEWYFENLGETGQQAFLNFGFRHELSKKLILMGSFGTQVETPQSTPRERFFSYTGLQWLI